MIKPTERPLVSALPRMTNFGSARAEPSHGVVVAVIPAYNEDRNIGRVVSCALSYVDRVIVVNDGSTDNTALVARSAGALVMNQRNQGAGAATRHGIVAALNEYPDLYAVALLDGDGQHDPDDLESMVRCALNGSDLVIGRRSITLSCMPFWRWFANKVFSVMRNLGAAYFISDAESGYRIFTRRALTEIGIDTKRFGFCEEVAIKARALGLTVTEVLIKTIYEDGEPKKYPSWKKFYHGLGIVVSILKWRWLYEWKPVSGRKPRLSASGNGIKRRSPAMLKPQRSYDRPEST